MLVKANESGRCKLRQFECEEDGNKTYYIGWGVSGGYGRITGLHITLHVDEDDKSVSGNVGVTYKEKADEEDALDELDFLYEDADGLAADGIEMIAQLLEVEGFEIDNFYGSESGMQDIGYVNLDVDFNKVQK